VLASAGVGVAESTEAKDEFFPGIPTDRAAKIVLAPSAGLTRAAVLSMFPDPRAVRISDRSVLLVEGGGVTVKSLDLDGTLVVRAAPGAKVVIDGLVVKNEGWALETLSAAEMADPAVDDRLKIRG
jgi:UDP-sugar pyrophosphorylase